MKVMILSDSHGGFGAMTRAIEKEGKIDMIIHAGDVVRDAEDLMALYPRQRIVFVRGNNDFWERDAADERFFTFDNVKIFLTHGHNYGVKYSLAKLKKHARDLGADVCIFGHTHSAYNKTENGIIMFNPGSVMRSYGILETNGGRPTVKICEN